MPIFSFFRNTFTGLYKKVEQNSFEFVIQFETAGQSLYQTLKSLKQITNSKFKVSSSLGDNSHLIRISFEMELTESELISLVRELEGLQGMLSLQCYESNLTSPLLFGYCGVPTHILTPDILFVCMESEATFGYADKDLTVLKMLGNKRTLEQFFYNIVDKRSANTPLGKMECIKMLCLKTFGARGVSF